VLFKSIPAWNSKLKYVGSSPTAPAVNSIKQRFINILKTKFCNKCKKIKSFSEFFKDKSRKDGYQNICKCCGKKYRQEHKLVSAKYRQRHRTEIAEYKAKYYQEHKEQITECKAKYYQEHKLEKAEYMAKYRQKHKAEITEYKAKYQQEHKLERAARNAKHRANKLNQTPDNVDFKKIIEFYKQAQQLTKETNIKYHVDHIIPLSKGGLHHENNLQIITATQNLRKSNKIC